MGARGPAPNPNSGRSKSGRNTRHRKTAAKKADGITAPAWVTSIPAASEFWSRVAPTLIADGRLAGEHVDTFGQLARLHAEILQLQEQLVAEGWITATDKGQAASPVAKLLRDARRDFLSVARDFGLTAAAAARIPQDPPNGEAEDDDPEAAVLAKLSIRNH